jgi:hypothetical protein
LSSTQKWAARSYSNCLKFWGAAILLPQGYFGIFQILGVRCYLRKVFFCICVTTSDVEYLFVLTDCLFIVFEETYSSTLPILRPGSGWVFLFWWNGVWTQGLTPSG